MNTIRHFIDHFAAERPDQPFLITPSIASPSEAVQARELTFSQLKEGVDQIGTELDRLGLERGTKAAFLLNNGYWTVQLFLGVMANNRVIVPLNAVAGTVQLQHVLGHSDAEVVFVSKEYQEKLKELLTMVDRDITVIRCDPEAGPEWPTQAAGKAPLSPPPVRRKKTRLCYLYTSGSTGLPKGAVLSHLAVTAGGKNVMSGHELTATDRALCVLPVYHINGAMVTVSAPLVSGGSVVMPNRFSASTFWPLIAEYGCTWSSLVPTIIKYLLDRAAQEPYHFGEDQRLSSFRFGRSASAPLPAVVLEQWEETFKIPMIETIGLTETAGTVATNPMPPLPRKPGR